MKNVNSIEGLRLSISIWTRKLKLAHAKCLAYGEIIDRAEKGFITPPRNLAGLLMKSVVKVDDVSVAKAKKEQDRIRKTKISFYEERISELSQKLREMRLIQEVLDQ